MLYPKWNVRLYFLQNLLQEMHDNIISPQMYSTFVNVNPSVPLNGVVVLQCNLFTVTPWEPVAGFSVCLHTVYLHISAS